MAVKYCLSKCILLTLYVRLMFCITQINTNMKRKLRKTRSWLFLVWILCLVVPIRAFAQGFVVKGVVVDSNEER